MNSTKQPLLFIRPSSGICPCFLCFPTPSITACSSLVLRYVFLISSPHVPPSRLLLPSSIKPGLERKMIMWLFGAISAWSYQSFQETGTR